MRTTYEPNKAAQIAKEQRTYNITVLGTCGTRWTLSGQVKLSTGEMELYTGHEEEDAHHREGMEFLCHKRHITPPSAGSHIMPPSAGSHIMPHQLGGM